MHAERTVDKSGQHPRGYAVGAGFMLSALSMLQTRILVLF